MPKLSDAERRAAASERAKQLAEGPWPQPKPQPRSYSDSPSKSQSEKQKLLAQSQNSIAPSRSADHGPSPNRTRRLFGLPSLLLVALAAYVTWTYVRVSSTSTSAPAGEEGATPEATPPSTDAVAPPPADAVTLSSAGAMAPLSAKALAPLSENAVAPPSAEAVPPSSAETVAPAASGTPTRLDAEPAGAKIDPSSMAPQELFGLWTHTYSVESGARRKLQLTSRNGSPIDMKTFNAESTVAGLKCTMSPTPTNRSGALEDDTTRGEAAHSACDCSEVPAAPHLQCCEGLAALRKQMDSRGPNGELPPWMERRPGRDGKGEAYPRPPWVRGGPSANLPQTHEAQADIWRHQNPGDKCGGNRTRFLVSYWDTPSSHGIGSHLHLMASVMGLAVAYGRVFGLLNDSFERAQHDGCKGPHFRSFECYFHLPTSQECDRRINDIWQAGDKAWRAARLFHDTRREPPLMDVLASDEAFIVVSPRLVPNSWDTMRVPTNWSKPWMKMVPYLSYGERRGIDSRVARRMQVSWWRAQAVRYLLRFPSEYLCHLLNFARHQTFGFEAAQLALSAQASGPAVAGGGEGPSNGSTLTLGGSCGVPPNACNGVRELARQSFRDQAPAWARRGFEFFDAVNPEPWAPHPLVRVHVRGTDKRTEMRTLSFPQYRDALARLRDTALPHARAIWISSEEQMAIREARKLPEWTVYTLGMERKWEEGQGMPLEQWTFAKKFGLRDYVEASLCSLFIGELSDGYLFALQSNWDRLANELRLTSGRMLSPFIPLNQGEL